MLGHPGWRYVLTHVYPSDMFLYLIWLRTTMAMTFTTICLDVIEMSRSSEDAGAAATTVATTTPATMASQTGVSPSSTSHPAHGATPTVLQLESLPPSSKVQITMEPKSEPSSQTRRHESALDEHAVKQEEMKQPELSRLISAPS